MANGQAIAADGPLLTADGIPLKQSLEKSLRQAKFRAVLLVLPPLLFLVFLQGVILSVNHPLLFSVVPELVTRNHSQRVIGINSALSEASALVAPILALMLIKVFGYWTTFVAHALGRLVFLLTILVCTPLNTGVRDSREEISYTNAKNVLFALLKDKSVIIIFITVFSLSLLARPVFNLIPAVVSNAVGSELSTFAVLTSRCHAGQGPCR